MIKLLLLFSALITFSVLAGESDFISAYDNDRYNDAAKFIGELDLSNREIARRLGVMYYDGRGVPVDTTKGKMLLESAMSAGDAHAAINLAKIYFKLEGDMPRSAWCLLVAEENGKPALRKDIERLHGWLGANYHKHIETYVKQLHRELKDEKEAFRALSEKSTQTENSLRGQVSALSKSKSDLEQRLQDSEAKVSGECGKVKSLTEKLAASDSRLADINQRLTDKDVELSNLRRDLEDALAKAKQNAEKLADAVRIKAASDKALAEEKIKCNKAESGRVDMYTKYCKLVEKYNDLVKKYNDLVKRYKRDTAMVPRDPECHDGMFMSDSCVALLYSNCLTSLWCERNDSRVIWLDSM